MAADPLQASAARVLDRIAHETGQPRGLFSRRKPVRGAYLVGAVGRGKTMLMDLFFAAAPVAEKRRVHFHEFMDEMHQAIAEFRKISKGIAEGADPVAAVAKAVIRDVRLLCLDEFQVSDITNAMLLGRLFERLFAAGVTLVATSNTLPGDLYRDGLNRQLFLPFIDLLEANAEIVTLDGPVDYRALKFAGEEVFRFGAGPETERAMDRLWARLSGGTGGQPAVLHSLGRNIVIPVAHLGAARLSFAAICEVPLGARDYLRLAHEYETVMIDHVPVFDRSNRDAAKRFILLIDTLYDRGIKLCASFAAPLEELGRDSAMLHEFARCVSRLTEMRSADYLGLAHRD